MQLITCNQSDASCPPRWIYNYSRKWLRKNVYPPDSAQDPFSVEILLSSFLQIVYFTRTTIRFRAVESSFPDLFLDLIPLE